MGALQLLELAESLALLEEATDHELGDGDGVAAGARGEADAGLGESGRLQLC